MDAINFTNSKVNRPVLTGSDALIFPPVSPGTTPQKKQRYQAFENSECTIIYNVHTRTHGVHEVNSLLVPEVRHVLESTEHDREFWHTHARMDARTHKHTHTQTHPHTHVTVSSVSTINGGLGEKNQWSVPNCSILTNVPSQQK